VTTSKSVNLTHGQKTRCGWRCLHDDDEEEIYTTGGGDEMPLCACRCRLRGQDMPLSTHGHGHGQRRRRHSGLRRVIHTTQTTCSQWRTGHAGRQLDDEVGIQPTGETTCVQRRLYNGDGMWIAAARRQSRRAAS
jgi:hypothetical protein